MKIHTKDIGTRIAGSLLGVAFVVAGVFALLVSGDAPDAAVGDRSFWLGVTVTFAGISAIAVSWLASDLTGIWCRPPRRFFHSD